MGVLTSTRRQPRGSHRPATEAPGQRPVRVCLRISGRVWVRVSGGRYWDRTSDLFGVNKVNFCPGPAPDREVAGQRIGVAWFAAVLCALLGKIVSQISPSGRAWLALLVVASQHASDPKRLPVAQALPGHAVPPGRHDERTGIICADAGAPVARHGCLRCATGGLGAHPRASRAAEVHGRAALAAGGTLRVVGPEALPAGGIAGDCSVDGSDDRDGDEDDADADLQAHAGKKELRMVDEHM